MEFRLMPQIHEIIAGKKCVIYADDQPQVLLSTLAWEKGGHFVAPHLRLARAFAWCVNSLTK